MNLGKDLAASCAVVAALNASAAARGGDVGVVGGLRDVGDGGHDEQATADVWGCKAG